MIENKRKDPNHLTASRHLSADLLAQHLGRARRILIWGEMGSGKSTLAMALGPVLTRHLGGCHVLSLDPGSPPFGVPGAVCRGWWRGDDFHWGDLQALCSLDAGRFRLPLLMAAQRLLGIAAKREGDVPILIDPPGVTRGVGAAELLHALVAAFAVDAIIAFHPPDRPLPLAAELAAVSIHVIEYRAADGARRPSKPERNAQRTRLWEHYLGNGREALFSIDQVNLLGTPPPLGKPESWADRQAALLGAGGETLAMGEVVRLDEGRLTLKLPSFWAADTIPSMDAVASILIRNAGRSSAGQLETLPPAGIRLASPHLPAEMTPPVGPGSRPISTRVGAAWATLVGGVLGDPLLHVRMHHRKESLLFDLGDAARLSAREAHQVRAVFLSHAHLDHVAGFIWFLRARIGFFGSCKIFGPPDTIARIESFLNAITWDRIEANGPILEVGEIHGDRLQGARLQAGGTRVDLPDRRLDNGVIVTGAHYHIQAVTCDHKIPSMAYALNFNREINVRKECLADLGWRAGPWLGHLKDCIAEDALDTRIELPDGTTRSAGDLAEALTLIHPGKKLVYAADMADTPSNRRKLIDLSRGAHTLFCEAAFCEADREKAAATQHLTTRAAVEIAHAAGVRRLVPFHFSKRYEDDPARIYAELREMTGPLVIVG